MKHLALLFFALFAIAGCSSDVGPNGLAVGGPCTDAFDCAAGSYCLRSLAFPDGMCTTNCGDDSDCRNGSTCVEQASGVCLLTCETDADCGREGYVCRERDRRGMTGRVRVCIGG